MNVHTTTFFAIISSKKNTYTPWLTYTQVKNLLFSAVCLQTNQSAEFSCLFTNKPLHTHLHVFRGWSPYCNKCCTNTYYLFILCFFSTISIRFRSPPQLLFFISLTGLFLVLKLFLKIPMQGIQHSQAYLWGCFEKNPTK